eukprot:4906997-Ditylum_brightwellii.AAC.1
MCLHNFTWYLTTLFDSSPSLGWYDTPLWAGLVEQDSIAPGYLVTGTWELHDEETQVPPLHEPQQAEQSVPFAVSLPMESKQPSLPFNLPMAGRSASHNGENKEMSSTQPGVQSEMQTELTQIAIIDFSEKNKLAEGKKESIEPSSGP